MKKIFLFCLFCISFLFFSGCYNYNTNVSNYSNHIKENNDTVLISSLIAIGNEQFEGGNYNKAIEYFNQVIDLIEGPDLIKNYEKYAFVYSNRGFSKYYLGDYKGALEDCNKAIEIYPNYSNYNSRAMMKFFLKDYQGVIDDVNESTTMTPKSYAYSLRGEAKINLYQMEEGCKDLQKGYDLGDTTRKELVEKCYNILNKTTAKNCIIKGNISYNTQEKIYHIPGCDDYEATVINTSYGERWFCTEDEARAAGWRKAYNCH